MPAAILGLAGGISGQQASLLLPWKEGGLGDMLEWAVFLVVRGSFPSPSPQQSARQFYGKF